MPKISSETQTTFQTKSTQTSEPEKSSKSTQTDPEKKSPKTAKKALSYSKMRRYSICSSTIPLELKSMKKSSFSSQNNNPQNTLYNLNNDSNTPTKNSNTYYKPQNKNKKFIFKNEKKQNFDILDLKKRTQTSLNSLLEEIELCLSTYPEIFKMKIPPSETGKGEIELNLKNEFIKEVNFSIDIKINFPFYYPKLPLEIELIDFGGVTHKMAENLVEILEEKSREMSFLDEMGLFEVVLVGVRWVEEVEEEQGRTLNRKNLFEIRLENEEKKSKE